jgi:hypothetical protein
MTDNVTIGKRLRPGYRPDGERYRSTEWYFDYRGVRYGGYGSRRDAITAALNRRDFTS